MKNVLILNVLAKLAHQNVTHAIQKQEIVPIVVIIVKLVKMENASIKTAHHVQSVLLIQEIVFFVVLARFV